MTKIAKIRTLDNSTEFINILKDKKLLIYEDVQGSKIFVGYNGSQFLIKPKSLKNDPLNFIDLAIQKFYNQAYKYMHTLPNFVTELLNNNWWFCFEYFPDCNPASIEYSRLPKNNLILTCIVKNGNYHYDYNEILEYSRLFDVDSLPVIFKGKLSDKQLEVIELYLNTSEKDLKFLFKEDTFAYFFYKILNPNLTNSFLMNNDEFNINLEKMIIKIDGRSQYSFEILNPLYNKMELTNNSEYVNIYSLILIQFLQFCQLIDLNKIKLFKITKDELYIEFICELFNKFMNDNHDNLINWNFIVPKFFREDKFKINIDLINNDLTKGYIKDNDKIEYIFKCILGSFSKIKKKPIGVFDDTSLSLFNNFVISLDSIISRNLNINIETTLQKQDLKNFKDYFKIKSNTDSQDEVYPDVFDEFDKGEQGESKKKKKGVKGIEKSIEKIPFEPKVEKL